MHETMTFCVCCMCMIDLRNYYDFVTRLTYLTKNKFFEMAWVAISFSLSTTQIVRMITIEHLNYLDIQ